MERFFEWLKCRVFDHADNDTVQLVNHHQHQRYDATDNDNDAEPAPLENASSCGGGEGSAGDDLGVNSSGVGVGAYCGDYDRRLHALELDNERHKSDIPTLHDAVAELQHKYKDILRWARGDVTYSATYDPDEDPDDQQQSPATVKVLYSLQYLHGDYIKKTMSSCDHCTRAVPGLSTSYVIKS
ncbi:hypothetical protein QAD02_011528 [Eretmocerus hayati]|uniref:Uncharacterized protein n=1 Tax=Eretmocerus hayati TaxID=131215 RepID=A0ACC2NX99_9HYME|nr:hypothetical protein QAD02_011528 [Eretmocerus hayati]